MIDSKVSVPTGLFLMIRKANFSPILLEKPSSEALSQQGLEVAS